MLWTWGDILQLQGSYYNEFIFSSDLDECSANAQVCDLNAKCINTRGSHHCLCHAGFTGDGKKCTGR